jgi:hypothetical protein
MWMLCCWCWIYQRHTETCRWCGSEMLIAVMDEDMQENGWKQVCETKNKK